MTTNRRLDIRIDAITDLARSLEPDRYPETDDYLQALRMIEQTIGGALAIAVAQARAEGYSWDRIGKQLGTNRSAAQQRFGGAE